MAPLTLTTTPILIVGGCGFLGHHIVRLLLDRYPTGTFHVLDLNTSLNRFPSVTYHSADITSVPAVRAIFEEVKPGVIINTVSPVAGLGKQIYFKVNVEGNKVLLEEAKRVGVKAFVFTSSASVVFNGEFEVRNGDESLPYADPPMDGYNESKVCLFQTTTVPHQVLPAIPLSLHSGPSYSVRIPLTTLSRLSPKSMSSPITTPRVPKPSLSVSPVSLVPATVS
jgi:hypothetical protein